MATLRQGRVRQNLSLLSLSALLGAQCLLPALAVAGDAKAAQRREEARQIQQKQEERAGARRAAQEAERRSKAQPVPAWYKRLRDGEKARLQQMRAAKAAPVAPVRLAQLPPAEQVAGGSVPAGGSFRDGSTTVDAFETLPKLPARATVTTQALAQMVSRSRMPWNRPRAAKPGVITPSAPLYVPNPLTTTKKMDLSGNRVPEQLEISRAGHMCGALAPAAPADTRVLAKQLHEELQKAGIAEGLTAQGSPVTPAGRLVDAAQKRLKRAQDANRDFALAMNLWNGRQWKASVKLLHRYAQKYPQSPWMPEALIHVADDAKFQGKPNDASDLYEQVMGMTSPKPGPMSYEAHQKAYERLADLFIIQGRYSQAWPLLADIANNDLHWRRRTWASHWMGQVEIMRSNRATMVAQRDCGNKALAMVLGSLGRKAEAQEVAALTPPREAGFNMAELQQVGQRNGLALKGFQAKAEQLAQLPLPLVLHYGFSNDNQSGVQVVPVSNVKGQAGHKYLGGLPKASGHFVVAWKVDQAQRLVHLENPQDGVRYVLSYSDLDREWSGRGLLLASRLDKGRKVERVAWLSNEQMRRTSGACFVVSKQRRLGRHRHNRHICIPCLKHSNALKFWRDLYWCQELTNPERPPLRPGRPPRGNQTAAGRLELVLCAMVMLNCPLGRSWGDMVAYIRENGCKA